MKGLGTQPTGASRAGTIATAGMNCFALAAPGSPDHARFDLPPKVCHEWSLDEVGLDDAESWEMYRGAIEAGFVPCQVYSVREPEGGYGLVHRNELQPIGETDFEAALWLLETSRFEIFEEFVPAVAAAGPPEPAMAPGPDGDSGRVGRWRVLRRARG